MGLGLLTGLKVLEMGDSVAVAFAGKLLTDLGADVLMVESPGAPLSGGSLPTTRMSRGQSGAFYTTGLGSDAGRATGMKNGAALHGLSSCCCVR